jgi:hypothetical protein
MNFALVTNIEQVPISHRGAYARWKIFHETMEFNERFWNRVEIKGEDDCWLWTGAQVNSGYGVVGLLRPNKRNILAHRMAWMLENGKAVPMGHFICHRCDVKLCCNPRHLFPGTPKSNVEDMIQKGRRVILYGVRPGNTKLTLEQAKEIKRLHATGEYSTYRLGKMFGVAPVTAWHVIKGNNWKCLS